MQEHDGLDEALDDARASRPAKLLSQLLLAEVALETALLLVLVEQRHALVVSRFAEAQEADDVGMLELREGGDLCLCHLFQARLVQLVVTFQELCCKGEIRVLPKVDDAKGSLSKFSICCPTVRAMGNVLHIHRFHSVTLQGQQRCACPQAVQYCLGFDAERPQQRSGAEVDCCHRSHLRQGLHDGGNLLDAPVVRQGDG
mmetsp:Transcript_57186/g.133754  ORF Transcript_57186/g.133754 Transcript_57186/m.133754 type:complete len:200 (+) Transcript_57186:1170-1769(+)